MKIRKTRVPIAVVKTQEQSVFKESFSRPNSFPVKLYKGHIVVRTQPSIAP